MMKMATNSYPIRAASKLAGITPDTLRAWERRYAAVVPRRGPRGRLYSEEDVKRLCQLRLAVDSGFPIGQVASLSDKDLEKLLSRTKRQALVDRRRSTTGNRTQEMLDPIWESLETFDFDKANFELSRLATLLVPRQFVLHILLPLLRRVGDAWHEGKLQIAQEHMISSIARNLLGTLLRLYRSQKTGPQMVLATPSGEQHEFGILAGALLAVGCGARVIYLGADLPAKEILSAATKSGAHAIVLGLTGTGRNSKAFAEARWLAQKLPARLELWIGGSTPEDLVLRNKNGQVKFLKSLENFENQVELLRTRVAR